MCRNLGIDSHLHALRHYSATTLRVYAAWVGASDRRAADILGSRLKRPASWAAARVGAPTARAMSVPTARRAA